MIVGEGTKHLVDVTVDLDGPTGSAEGSVTATDGHPFYVPNRDRGRRWLSASELTAGDELRASDGHLLTVVATHRNTERREVRNLTVDGIPTYYVLAGSTPVLVHNCNFADAAKEAAH